MSGGRGGRLFRSVVVAALLAVVAVPLVSGAAVGEETIGELERRIGVLEDRMAGIQSELDATTARIEKLRDEAEEVRARISDIQARKDELEGETARLEEEAARRADLLYRQGTTGAIELLLGSEDVADLTSRAEMLTRVSIENAGVFVKLSRNNAELEQLSGELAERRRQLEDNADALAVETKRLQEQFQDVSNEYNKVKSDLAAARAAALRAARARREARREQQAQAVAQPAPAPQPVVHTGGGMACPVAGPVSFVDSWGAPRSGHTHQGVDMMADYGTPVVAIVSGTVTYSGYSGSGGNMIFLAGDNGHQYWYMHNQENLVGGGHVSTGQQIATVGDTGNATGIPHLHFEYHPGGGGAVNPYPLVASIC